MAGIHDIVVDSNIMSWSHGMGGNDQFHAFYSRGFVCPVEASGVAPVAEEAPSVVDVNMTCLGTGLSTICKHVDGECRFSKCGKVTETAEIKLGVSCNRLLDSLEAELSSGSQVEEAPTKAVAVVYELERIGRLIGYGRTVLDTYLVK